ncbi:MAG: translation initiation factor IF-2 [Pseudomonadota bacterium]|nr:translation initiation factor IF-2 [Pseudomonadota bacterium]
MRQAGWRVSETVFRPPTNVKDRRRGDSKMTEQDPKNDEKPKRVLSTRPRLELKKTVDGGQVRQSFSHGRTKSVAVEVRRKRSLGKATVPVSPQETVIPSRLPDGQNNTTQSRKPSVLKTLTKDEAAARRRALQSAQQNEAANELLAKNTAEAEARRQAALIEDETRRLEREEQNRKEEQERRRQDEVLRRRQEEEATERAAEQAAKLEARAEKADRAPRRVADLEEKVKQTRNQVKRPPARRGEPRRRSSGKLTVTQALNDEERTRSLASVKRQRERIRRVQQSQPLEAQKTSREVTLPDSIAVQDLANRMAERGVDVIRALLKLGVMATPQQLIDSDTAELVIDEFGHKVRRVSDSDVEVGLKGEEDPDDLLSPRSPVVTVMGHVDHGKTSLLDALRKTNLVDREAGGITQHIGAYQIESQSGDKVTFIDTPGHAAFTSMRARGANVTDIVILVVAADDGIMPQTVEAIDHAKAAKVPIIVAINKVDKPEADPRKVRNELLQHEILLEDVGGDVLSVEVSATEGTNLDKLTEAIHLQAEILELKANPDRSAEGVVIEANLETGRGAMATVLVQRGTLRIGDIVVAGGEWGRVRAISDHEGGKVDLAIPAQPVEIMGLSGAPEAGEDFAVVGSEARAREVSEFRQRKKRLQKTKIANAGTIENIFSQIEAGKARNLPLVVKADTHGSAEAIVNALEKLGTDEVKVQVLHSGVGGISESDVGLAKASEGFVVGFNVRANAQARNAADRDKLDIRYFSVIYDLTDDIKALLSGLLTPEKRETFLGYAEILEVFNISKMGKVAGCKVTQGLVKRGSGVRLLRDDVVIHEGALSTLKRFKEDAREVREGTECGMSFENYQDLKTGDMIECFEVEEIARHL